MISSLEHCMNLDPICRDRRLETSEIHSVNGFYGHAEILKAYAGLPGDYPLKAMIMHAPGWEHHIWDVERNSPLPFFLCSSEKYAQYFNEHNGSGKTAVPIGPMISYLEQAKRRLPGKREKTMVFFPLHSTHHIHAASNPDDVLRRLESVRMKFDRCLVCIYWKDYLLGRHERFIEEGYTCVSAGHIYDPLFLYRLRDIILAADLVVSGRPGTEVIYAALLDRPVYIEAEEVKMVYAREELREEHKAILNTFNPGRTYLPRLFSKPVSKLHPDQSGFVRNLVGADHLKSPNSLRDILLAAEIRYSSKMQAEPDRRILDGDRQCNIV